VLNTPGLDPDRLLPVDPTSRAIARELYSLVAELPIISPHGHVDPRLFVNEPGEQGGRLLGDPASLLVSSDHYVVRLLHAAGVPLHELGISDRLAAQHPDATPAQPREIWRRLCENWNTFAGTASGYWLRDELSGVFGLTEELSAATADSSFDRLSALLDEDRFRARTLFGSFGVEVLSTTDDPLDDLATHAALRDDPGFACRVLPTFRPDAYLDPSLASWRGKVEALASWAGDVTPTYNAFIAALEARRAHFVQHGAVSADHGVGSAITVELERSDAVALFDRALTGSVTPEEAAVLQGHLLLESARMSVADGLVMTVHTGVRRNHHSPTFSRYGTDTGHDIPITASFTDTFRPLLSRYGTDPDFHLILFSLDETTWSREVAPLAGFYPSVYIGAPWWFLDAPDAILRFRAATTETAGFYRGSGFIDDTRALLSIPTRHDTARRLDSAFLARLVAEGRIARAQAERIAVDLVTTIPRKAFKL
jgi:glucuronate isomerase